MMRTISLTAIALSVLVGGCTTIKLATKDVAALYSTLNSQGYFAPITYSYGIVRAIDDKGVPFNENPVFIEPGRHKVEIKYGQCFAPVLVIACDFQAATVKTIEHEFVGGRKYRLTSEGNIIEVRGT